MDRAAPALPPHDDRGPLAAFAALVLLPIALLALAGTLPGPAASPASVAPVETARRRKIAWKIGHVPSLTLGGGVRKPGQ